MADTAEEGKKDETKPRSERSGKSSRSGKDRDRRGGDRKDKDRDRRSRDRDRRSRDRDGRSKDRDGRSKDRDRLGSSRRSKDRDRSSDRDNLGSSDRDRRRGGSSRRNVDGSRRSVDSSRRSVDSSIRTSDSDREAKRRARASRSEGTPARPGAVSVADDSAASRREQEKARRSSRPSSATSSTMTKEERMSMRAQEEQHAKRRAKEGRTSSTRPGVSSSGVRSSASMASSDREAKRRAKDGRSGAPSRPGAQMASSQTTDEIRRKQKMQGRPGSSASRGADNRKNLEHNSADPAVASEPVAAAADDNGEVAVEAVAIDEQAEENERMRALEEQNRELAERMNQMMHNPRPVRNTGDDQAENDREKEREREEEEQRIEEEKAKKKKRNICILVLLVLAVGGGVAAYFLTKSSDAPVATPVSSPDKVKDTPAPIAPPVVETPPPTALDISEGPSSAPTIDTYDPPSLEDCVRIRGGLPIEGQEELETSPFRMSFDVKIKDPDLPAGSWVPDFKEGIDEVLIPFLAGCDISRRRLQTVDQGLVSESQLRKPDSKTMERAFHRGLQEIESDIRYVVGNAKATINPSRDVTDGCEIKRTGCNNVRVVLELFLKGEEKGFAIITLIAQVLQALVDLEEDFEDLDFEDLEEDSNRQLENNEEQRHHRKLLTRIFGLDPDIFDSCSYRGIENILPTTSPSVSPSQVPSKVPSMKPSRVPSISPSFAPTTVAPSPEPTLSPTVGPTKSPTPEPTEEPTPEPTLSPTERPTRATPRPVDPQTPQPVNPQTPQPFFSNPYTTFPYSEEPHSDGPYSEPPYSFAPYNYDGPTFECEDDVTFLDDEENDCFMLAYNDPLGLKCDETGWCGEYESCSAMEECCACSGGDIECFDNWSFLDDENSSCEWYYENDWSPAQNCPLYGDSYGGSCVKDAYYECAVRDACCYCDYII